MLGLESGCLERKDDASENSDEDCWSMAVNLEEEDLASKPGSWLLAIVNSTVAKMDTGQNLRYCVQVLGALLGAFWHVVRSMFG